jgi:hypothetical protein
METENLWTEFNRTMTWGGLLHEYLDAMQHVERYKATHPERELPVSVYSALQSMVKLYEGVRPIAENPAMHGQPASPEAVNLILATVGRVRRNVPTVAHMGHA